MSAQGVDDFPHVAVVWVGIEQDDDEQYRWVDQVIPFCLAPDWAPCRTYCAEGCEHWPCDHQPVAGQACWIGEWIANDMAEYVDSDSDGPPPVPRVGRITATWEHDYLAWEWAS